MRAPHLCGEFAALSRDAATLYRPKRSGIISIQQPAQTAQDRAFFLSPPPSLRRGGRNPSGQPAERQRLQPDMARTAQRGEEETLATEKSALDFAHVFDVVIHAGLKGHNASSIHADDFARLQLPFVDRPARVNECQAIALQPFQDEPFPAKQARTEALGKRNAQANTFSRAKERVLLR